ncbi:hypothetical protein HGRIS_000707 [Hohenbuehelia grisea]|uniref:Uncharacterized protein n=1 Tax=Hohenbuehelia grisea TaxID=104357 RepID=A0ABR3JSR5_9AGAR
MRTKVAVDLAPRTPGQATCIGFGTWYCIKMPTRMFDIPRHENHLTGSKQTYTMVGIIIQRVAEAAKFVGKTSLKKNWTPDHSKTLYQAIRTGVSSPVGGSTRCWPKKSGSLDKKIGIRFDWGDPAFKDAYGFWWRILNLQLNANAEQEAIRKTAQKDGTHAVRAKIWIPTTTNGGALHPDVGEAEVQDQLVVDLLKHGV